MNLIFFGIPGAGKGTQAKIIAKKLRLCHISSGELLRSTAGSMKKEISDIINKGNLIPDELMLKLLVKHIANQKCENGIILDGFPRNINQAQLLDKEINIDKVVEIKISDNESRKRLFGRVICEKCGEGYNNYTAPKPKVKDMCDICDSKLIKRKDDNLDAIINRIEQYHKETEPILNYYRDKVLKIDGERDIQEISEDILKNLI